MPNKFDLRLERDEALVWAFTDRAGTLKDRYQEWITSECKDLIIQGQTILPSLNGIVEKRMRSNIRHLRGLQRECDQSCHNIVERCQELRQGGWDDILEDHTYLDEHLSKLHATVRELHDLRRVFDALENPSETPDNLV